MLLLLICQHGKINNVVECIPMTSNIETHFQGPCPALLLGCSTVTESLAIYVGGSSKIQTLCHMTQVLLKLAMERLTGY